MAYRIVSGFLSVEGRSPDGDTVAFYLNEENLGDWVWTKTKTGRFPSFNKSFQTNVRFEGIDALELHYRDRLAWPAVDSHQKKSLALDARNRMLDLCGFDRSAFTESANHTLRDPSNQLIPATVAYNDVDPFGRLIGFVFNADDSPELSNEDDPERFLSVDDVKRSVNAKLLKEGLVFPTFYGGLYTQLREAMTELTLSAMNDADSPIWQAYQPTFVMDRGGDLEALKELVIMPKLYRRLFTHLARNGAVSGFRSFLRESNDTMVDTQQVRLGYFGNFVSVKDVDGNREKYRVTLLRQPHELIMLPD